MDTISVGRIVHYRVIGEDRWLPAIVTHVWSEDCVNLLVFHDGSHDIDLPPTDRYTSVMQGDGEGNWRWPVRI